MNLAKGIFLVVILLSLFGLQMYGQEVLLPRSYVTSNVGIVYDREISFPVALHTNGFYLGFNSGKLKTYYKTTYWGFSIGHLKDPREFKQSDIGSGIRNGAGSFILGKQSTLIPVRLNKGWKKYYSGKDRRRGVAIGTSFEIGVTAGVTKAYTLQVEGNRADGSNPNPNFITYNDNPVAFLDRNRINGTGGLRNGWSEMRITPGINAKAAVHLDWGAFEEFMRGVEAGIMIDAFPTEIALLTPPANNNQLFINFYLALQLGKRR